MGEKPSGLHAAIQPLLNLMDAHTHLAGAHQLGDSQPQMEEEMAILENGPHADGKGRTAGIALVEPWPGWCCLSGLQTRPQPRVMEVRSVWDELSLGPGLLNYPKNLPQRWVC